MWAQLARNWRYTYAFHIFEEAPQTALDFLFHSQCARSTWFPPTRPILFSADTNCFSVSFIFFLSTFPFSFWLYIRIKIYLLKSFADLPNAFLGDVSRNKYLFFSLIRNIFPYGSINLHVKFCLRLTFQVLELAHGNRCTIIKLFYHIFSRYSLLLPLLLT